MKATQLLHRDDLCAVVEVPGGRNVRPTLLVVSLNGRSEETQAHIQRVARQVANERCVGPLEWGWERSQALNPAVFHLLVELPPGCPPFQRGELKGTLTRPPRLGQMLTSKKEIESPGVILPSGKGLAAARLGLGERVQGKRCHRRSVPTVTPQIGSREMGRRPRRTHSLLTGGADRIIDKPWRIIKRERCCS